MSGHWRPAADGGQRKERLCCEKQPLDGGCECLSAARSMFHVNLTVGRVSWRRSRAVGCWLNSRLDGGDEWPLTAGEVNIEYMSAARSMFHANLTVGQVSWRSSLQALRLAQVLVQSWSC
jgi:hypothetical protein